MKRDEMSINEIFRSEAMYIVEMEEKCEEAVKRNEEERERRRRREEADEEKNDCENTRKEEKAMQWHRKK
jgi:hypothetical protein